MAAGFKSGGNDFKKGKKGGPGRPKSPIKNHEKPLKGISWKTISTLMETYGNLTVDEIQALYNSPNIPIFRKAICGIWYEIMKEKRIRDLKEACIMMAGEQKKTLEVEGNQHMSIVEYIEQGEDDGQEG